MPSNGNKKNGKKKKKRKNKVYLPLGGFKSSQVVRLRYVTGISLDASGVSYAKYIFGANCLYDPDITGAGHQPSNYDVWAVRYKNWSVLGSKITATVTPDDNANLIPGYVGIYMSENKTEAEDALNLGIATVCEQQSSRSVIFKRCPGANQLPSNGLTLTQTFSPARTFGKSKKYLRDAKDYSGVIGANPTERAYFTLWQMNINSTNPGQVNLLVKIEFLVRFYGLNPQQNS